MREVGLWKCPNCGNTAEMSYENLVYVGLPICNCDFDMELEGMKVVAEETNMAVADYGEPWRLEYCDGYYINDRDGNGVVDHVGGTVAEEERRGRQANYAIHCVNSHKLLIDALRRIGEIAQNKPVNALDGIEIICKNALISFGKGGDA